MAAIFTSPIVTAPGEAPLPFRPRPPLRLIEGGKGAGSPTRTRKRRRALAIAVTGAVALVIVIASALVFSAVESSAGTAVADSGPQSAAAAGPVVVVQSGDTLTSIARDLQPQGDITRLVDRLAAIHGPGPLQAGDRLVLDSRVRSGA